MFVPLIRGECVLNTIKTAMRRSRATLALLWVDGLVLNGGCFIKCPYWLRLFIFGNGYDHLKHRGLTTRHKHKLLYLWRNDCGFTHASVVDMMRVRSSLRLLLCFYHRGCRDLHQYRYNPLNPCLVLCRFDFCNWHTHYSNMINSHVDCNLYAIGKHQ